MEKISATLGQMLMERMDALSGDKGQRASQDQRHLNEGSSERIYWHYGYASALKDVIAILNGAGGPVN